MAEDKTTSTQPKTYGLKLPSTLSIASTASAKQTAVLLSSAMTALQLAYTDLAFPSTAKATSKTNTASSGVVSTYMQDKISNYQLALSRLSGG